MSSQAIKVVAVFVLAGVLAAVVRVHPQPIPEKPPMAASGGYKVVLARQHSMALALFNRVPESWHEVNDATRSSIRLQSHPDDAGDDPHLTPEPVESSAVILLQSGVLCDDIDCDSWAQDMITETVYFSGRPGVLYRGAVEEYEG